MPRWTDDDGFTLVETLVSIAVIGVVMTSLTAFFTNSLSIDNQQRGKQAAAQIVDDAMERVRSLKGSGITAGRDQSSSDSQWSGRTDGRAELPERHGRGVRQYGGRRLRQRPPRCPPRRCRSPSTA